GVDHKSSGDSVEERHEPRSSEIERCESSHDEASCDVEDRSVTESPEGASRSKQCSPAQHASSHSPTHTAFSPFASHQTTPSPPNDSQHGKRFMLQSESVTSQASPNSQAIKLVS